MQQHCLYTDTYICYNDDDYNDHDVNDDEHDDMIITIITIKMTKTMMMRIMITSIPVVCFHSCCITTRLSVELQAKLYYTFIIKQAHQFPISEIGHTGKWVYRFHFPLLKTFKIVYVCENVPFLTRVKNRKCFCCHNEKIHIRAKIVACKKLSL